MITLKASLISFNKCDYILKYNLPCLSNLVIALVEESLDFIPGRLHLLHHSHDFHKIHHIDKCIKRLYPELQKALALPSELLTY